MTQRHYAISIFSMGDMVVKSFSVVSESEYAPGPSLALGSAPV